MQSRLDWPRPDAWVAAAIVGAFVAGAALIGYVIALGEPVPIALVLGMIAGVALLGALPVVVWTVLVGVMLLSGPAMLFVPELDKANWLFSLLGFFLAGASALYAAIGRDRFRAPMPGFVVLAVLFMVYGLLSIAYSGGPLSEGVRAAKRYFQFFGLLFVLAVVPFSATLVRRWWGFLLLVGLVQLPFAAWQRAVLVPMREGMPNVVPIDIVVGTMEGSMKGGGNSAMMVLLLVLLIGYALSAWREGLMPMRRLVPVLLALGAPLMMGAVTLALVLVPIALAVVFVDVVRRRPLAFVGGGLVVGAIAAGAVLAYLAINAEPGETAASIIEGALAYNFGEKSYYGIGLNRANVYAYWAQHHGFGDPVRLFFGHGLGSAFGAVGEPNPGHMDEAHTRMFIGLTAAASILWDLGLVGAALWFGMHLVAARAALRLAAVARPGFDRALARGLALMTLFALVMQVYSTAPIATPTYQVVFALCVGLVAWRIRTAASDRLAPAAARASRR